MSNAIPDYCCTLIFMDIAHQCLASSTAITLNELNTPSKIGCFVEYSKIVSFQEASVGFNAIFLRKIWLLNKNMMNFLNCVREGCLQVGLCLINPSFIPIPFKFYLTGSSFQGGKMISKKRDWMLWTMRGNLARHLPWVFYNCLI